MTASWEQAVDTTATERSAVRAGFSRGCMIGARHGCETFLPVDGPVTLVRRVWRCLEPVCPARTWSETSPPIRARASLPERARREACRRVGQDGHSVAQVAAEFGVAWGTVVAAVVEYGTPLMDDPDRLGGVTALGVDETAFLRATKARHTQYVTGIVDVRASRLLYVVQGRSGTVLSQWVQRQETSWRHQVSVAALDLFRGLCHRAA
jgi:hypothetical protein